MDDSTRDKVRIRDLGLVKIRGIENEMRLIGVLA